MANAADLSDLVLHQHSLSGAVPALPDSLYWLDLKGNKLSKLPGGCLTGFDRCLTGFDRCLTGEDWCLTAY